jgi:hypothetical integral membrane protein (TIGR02206 family)
VLAVVSPVAYGLSVVVGLGACAGACVAARLRPGPWTLQVARLVGLCLAVDACSYTIGLIVAGTWSARTSLPLALCDVAVLVAAVACIWRTPLLVELTYFWGLAGTLQGVLTPDLSVGFPHLVFWQYVVGHLGIVFAALFLVIGLGIAPRRYAVPRVLAITIGYTALVGLVDAISGANYMFLRRPPGEWTLLRLLGPWPWYLASATGVAIVLFLALDAPFWASRRRQAAQLALQTRPGETTRPNRPTRPSRSDPGALRQPPTGAPTAGSHPSVGAP